MVFTSWHFVAFLAAVLIALRIAPTRTWRQLTILLASVYFYGSWNAWYLLLLAAPSVIDYVCAIRIEDSADARARKRWLVASLVSNLGLLAYFKYADFFVQSIAAAVGVEVRHLDILLPVGISFYIFKTLSYTIDVYRREIPASRSLWQYAMFVTYFPELVAGPIVRASVFLPQMGRSLTPSWSRAAVGAQMILLGVTKKLVVADRLAPFVDAVFATPAAYSPMTIASAVVAYSLQIYCDFSGYTDIAIGVSRIIGYDLPENFNMPYLSTSVTEFWRRWHITLSQWLRDYLYIPLGGNRKGRVRTYVNLAVTMLLGGLWHGASWNFVLWGLLHGVALAAHKLWSGSAIGRRVHIPPVLGWAATYAFVCLTWVFFRALHLSDALLIVRKLVGLEQGGIEWVYLPLLLLLPLVALAHVVGRYVERRAGALDRRGRRLAPPPRLRWGWARTRLAMAVRPHPASGWYFLVPIPGFAGGFVIAAWLVLVFFFSSLNTSPFIYFQF